MLVTFTDEHSTICHLHKANFSCFFFSSSLKRDTTSHGQLLNTGMFYCELSCRGGDGTVHPPLASHFNSLQQGTYTFKFISISDNCKLFVIITSNDCHDKKGVASHCIAYAYFTFPATSDCMLQVWAACGILMIRRYIKAVTGANEVSVQEVSSIL